MNLLVLFYQFCCIILLLSRMGKSITRLLDICTTKWRRGGMVDALDSKSNGCEVVWVQVPPSLPCNYEVASESWRCVIINTHSDEGSYFLL